MKSKNFTRKSLGIFSLVLVSLGVAASSSFFRAEASTQFAQTSRSAKITRNVDPDDYTNVSTSELSCSIKDYTGTSLSRFLKVQFQSKRVEAYKTNREDVFYVIDDPNYSEDNNNPFIVPTPDKTLNGFTYRAEFSSSTVDQTLYISDSIARGQRFIIKNTRIARGCVDSTTVWGDVNTIYICKGVTKVDENAFTSVPNTVTIKCEAESKPAGWDDNWTEAATNVQWGVAIPDPSQRNVQHYGSTAKFGEAKDFILGYKGNSELGIDAYPLTLKYNKTLADSTVVHESIEIPTKHPTNSYDAVGTTIYSDSNMFQIAIDIAKDENVDETSFELYNIFEAKKHYKGEKSAWPTEELEKIYEVYSANNGLEEKFPTMEGNNFLYQLFETEADKYITIHIETESDEAAAELVSQYEALLLAERDEDDKPYYTLDSDEYDELNYGKVYKREVVAQNNEHYGMYVQLYVYNKHFISYLIIDHLQQAFTDEGEPVVNESNEPVYIPSRPLPINTIGEAVKPYEWIPDIDDVGPLKSVASRRYGKITNFSDIFEYSYVSSSSFLGYTSVAMNVTKKLVTAYAGYLIDEDTGLVDETKQYIFLLKDGKYYNGKNEYEDFEVKINGRFSAPEIYINDDTYRGKAETNINSLLDGKFSFRYVLSDLNNAKLVVRYLKNNAEVTKYLPIKSPSPVIELSSVSQRVSFMANSGDLEGVRPEDILYLGISGMTVNVHLYNTSAHAIVQNTNLLKIFGNLEVLPYTGKGLAFFNINTYLIIFIVALTAAYAIGAVALFFYLKNKYKNDEFRRMRPKQYVKTSLATFLGVLLIALGINFIVLRFAVFNSSVPTFNPIDPFVMGFGIAMAIAIGLFIRMFVIMGKTAKKRREAKRLKLDKDVVDDGTH